MAIVGGGPAGLAAAACVKRLGFTPRVLEQSPAIGTRWRGHYDRLRLHTTRRMSSLPGLEIPPRFGRWVSRDDFARYQELYAAHHRISVEAGTSVARIDRVARTDDRGGFRVETSRGPIEARHVIVATGYNNVPRTPTWPGTEQFAGELAHSSRFKNGEPYRGKRVIVVGTGNSGAEIATDLADHGATVWWSVRTPPTILRRDLYGIPVQGVGVALEALPPQLVDRVIRVFRRFTVGDLDAFGLPMPARGPYVRALTERVLPILDVGIVAAIRAGRVRVVPEIQRFEADGGRACRRQATRRRCGDRRDRVLAGTRADGRSPRRARRPGLADHARRGTAAVDPRPVLPRLHQRRHRQPARDLRRCAPHRGATRAPRSASRSAPQSEYLNRPYT